MSLLSYVTGRDHQLLRESFKNYFPRKPAFDGSAAIISSPRTKNYAVVGGAFDYLLRFHIEQLNEKGKIISGPWIAERMYKSWRGSLGLKSGLFTVERDAQRALRLEFLNHNFANAIQSYEKFIADGIVSDNLMRSCIFLARLEACYRNPTLFRFVFDDVNQEDIADLYALIDATDLTKFRVRVRAYLNPDFGKGSQLVHGADADLILDDTLIEIKVVQRLCLKQEYLNQLIGYYALSLFGGVNGQIGDSIIKNIGIYFARHGVLWTAPLSFFGNDDRFRRFTESFVGYVEETKRPIHSRLSKHSRQRHIRREKSESGE